MKQGLVEANTPDQTEISFLQGAMEIITVWVNPLPPMDQVEVPED